MSEKTKKFKVLSTTPLVKDAVVDLHDLQISASNDQGIITMVDMEAVEQEETNASYEIKPGIWRITPKAGLTPLELSDETYFETDTYRTLTKKFTNFRNKLETVFGKYGLMKKRAYLLGSDPGCHAKGQGILMYDGSIKKVEDIVVGDLLMGPNSKPREVLRLIRGRDKMVRIIPRKGDPFVVNWNHVQPFVSSHYDEYFFSPINQMLCDDFCHGDSKLYRSEAINFTPNANKLPMPPYVLGLWLGDGTVSKPQLTTMDPEIAKAWSEYGRTLGCKITVRTKPGGLAKTYDIAKVEGRSNPLITILESFGYNLKQGEKSTPGQAKFIPSQYMTASFQERLGLLAGIIDTDGEYGGGKTALDHGCFTVSSKYEGFAKQIAFIARSCGFYAFVRTRLSKPTVGPTGVYWVISISGNIEQIPTKVARKIARDRQQIKNVLRTGYRTEVLPEDDFFGFTVSDDHLYLLEDFTVTHNCGKSSCIRQFNRTLKNEEGMCILQIDSEGVSWETIINMFIKSKPEDAKFIVLVIEDIGGAALHERAADVSSTLLNFLDGTADVFKIPTLIVATTNFLNELGGQLNDRPGRFDDTLHVEPPNDLEIQFLVESFFKREMTAEEKKAILGKKFTPAYAREAMIRAELEDITIDASVKQVVEQREKAKKKTHGMRSGGVGFCQED